MEQNQDLYLIQRYKNSHNLDVLGELFHQYIHLVYGLCLKYLLDREESKDAVSAIFELLIVEIEKHEITNFKSWLYVVSKNYCLGELRKKNNEEKKKNEFLSVEFMESTEISHPIDGYIGNDLSDSLKVCIEKLKDEQKKCISLFYYQDTCYRDIAEKLDIDIKKVKSFIQNGKRNLKKCIEADSRTHEI
ncbi:sigma-70 family RNA polymerase sigma factor [Bacteroidales bacterium]|nr:sigma-70 family RNA polymerase sigma factor [Bacteroidales bacterium]